jgi:hypothetical protein
MSMPSMVSARRRASAENRRRPAKGFSVPMVVIVGSPAAQVAQAIAVAGAATAAAVAHAMGRARRSMAADVRRLGRAPGRVKYRAVINRTLTRR